MVLAIVLLGFSPTLSHSLYFHPAHDSLWRGMLAQLVHLDGRHLLWNLATFLVMIVLACRLGRLGEVPGCMFVSALAVCLGLKSEVPPLDWYVGLSGALHGLCACIALAVAWAAPRLPLRVAALAVFAGTGVKAWLGLGTGIMPSSIPVAYGAHLYGFMGGCVYATAAFVVTRYGCGRPRPAA